MRPLEIISVLACDDVREETQGKFSLLGVLSPNFSLEDMPGTIKLWFALIVNTIAVGVDTLTFRIITDQGVELGKGSGSVETKRIGGPLILPIGPFPLGFEQPTKFSLEREGEDGWEALQSWEVSAPSKTPPKKAVRSSKRKPSAQKV